jgi:hypothetical protein
MPRELIDNATFMKEDNKRTYEVIANYLDVECHQSAFL